MATAPEFTTIPREKRLSTLAADQIEKMIIDARLPAGERLPTERQLAESLGVSRTVIREAVRLLEAKRLVKSAPGGSLIVIGAGAELVAESLQLLVRSAQGGVSFADVQSVRAILEVGIAGLAARHATAEDIARIHSAYSRMIGATNNADHVLADYDYHLAIAQATHNPLFVMLLQAMNDVIIQGWREYWAGYADLGDASLVLPEVTQSNALHGSVLRAIESGQAGEARKAMVALLDNWQDIYDEMRQHHPEEEDPIDVPLR